MAIPLSTIDELVEFTGKPVTAYQVLGTFVDQAIAQATLLFSLATGCTALPTDPIQLQLAKYGILQMADKIFEDRLYAGANSGEFQSETIGSYSYNRFAQKITTTTTPTRDSTGVPWFDLAVDQLACWDTGNTISSAGIAIFEHDGLVNVNGHLWVPGPLSYNRITRGYLEEDPSAYNWYTGEGEAGKVVIVGGGGGTEGEVGTSGDVLDSFTYYQHDPSSEWHIAHYLNGFPDVVVRNLAGEIVNVGVNYVDDYNLIVEAIPALAGVAELTL